MKNKFTIFILFCFTIFILTMFGCYDFSTKVSADKVYTLYRSSVLVDNMRIHVATFDVDDSDEYNCKNCNVAASLFQSQPGVIAKYWCEKGYYKE